MNSLKSIRTGIIAFCLGLLLLTANACGNSQVRQPSPLPPTAQSQLERGDTAAGERYGQWVVQTASGLVSDAYVRDNDKLGVVITPQVQPQDVKDLARSLIRGFHNNFPDRNVSVLVYAPDQELILTADYDDTTRQIAYH